MWDELPEDVRAEIEDPNYKTRTHGKRSTHSTGCNGPLCRKANRDAAERRYRARRVRQGFPEPRVGLKDDSARANDEQLEKIQRWHERQRELDRLNKLVQPDAPPEEDDANPTTTDPYQQLTTSTS